MKYIRGLTFKVLWIAFESMIVHERSELIHCLCKMKFSNSS